MADTSDSAILDTRFPGYSWMPRWTRKYWTPSVAGSLVVLIFSAGVWWGTFKTAPDLSILSKAVAPECVRGCLLKKEDIALMADHVDELWHWKKRIDNEAELHLQQIPAPQTPTPARRHR